MKILVLNAGSSSVKYSLFAMHNHSVLVAGLIERIGEKQAVHRFNAAGAAQQMLEMEIANHQAALQELFRILSASGLLADSRDLACIGHRVVHGGEHFWQPALITPQVLAQITATIPLAPLHNPANLLGIQEAIKQMPIVPQVAVFDTAFHHTMPDYAYRYALPAEFYREQRVRRYGFHGTSHGYVAKLAAQFLGKPLAETNLITLHLGNGASVTAIENGKSVDTSMGLTPLEGVMMGTRCGDIDPAIIFYLGRTLNISNDAIETLLNKNSGCKGVCGENDMRSIHKLAESDNLEAKLALAMYAYRLKKYIGAYFAVLNRVDALVFTGGIGENDAWLRETCCANLSALGIDIDHEKNQTPLRPCADISASRVAVLVIKTDEELEIAIQAKQCLEAVV
ncbi:acetate kinase [Methylomonas sp. AM2-LC]|uniref:acetate/propionate family kinase n=1 Tax=Methylomonas sp. AM2-LC TaxID=3153301 RepID=UPI0032650EF4